MINTTSVLSSLHSQLVQKGVNEVDQTFTTHSGSKQSVRFFIEHGQMACVSESRDYRKGESHISDFLQNAYVS